MTAKKKNSAAKVQGSSSPAAKTGGAGGEKKNQAKAKSATARVRTPDKRKVRETMEAAVLKKGKAVIEAVIKEAEKGGYLPAKYLFEFAGINEPLPEPASEAGGQAGTLMQILLGATKEQSAGETAAQEQTSGG